MPCRITIEARATLTIDAPCHPDGAQDYVDGQLFEHDADWELSDVEVIEVTYNGSGDER